MTRKKPPGKSWESWIDQQIREAREEGELSTIWSLRTETEVRKRVAAINEEIAKVNARRAEGPPTRLAPLDANALVDDWRRRSEATEHPTAESP